MAAAVIACSIHIEWTPGRMIAINAGHAQLDALGSGRTFNDIVRRAGHIRTDPQYEDQQHEHGESLGATQTGKQREGGGLTHLRTIHRTCLVMEFHCANLITRCPRSFSRPAAASKSDSDVSPGKDHRELRRACLRR
ncbi:MAG: hypothetical protein IPP82_02185 [Xanthomonadales bacterium]|nr:hypothetical protein [Xanthomonadales bacterium]